MIPWLREARLDLYRELTEILPEQIQYLWTTQAPLEQFGRSSSALSKRSGWPANSTASI